jgi:hypothetical protein
MPLVTGTDIAAVKNKMLLGEKCECKPIIVLNFCELERDFRRTRN